MATIRLDYTLEEIEKDVAGETTLGTAQEHYLNDLSMSVMFSCGKYRFLTCGDAEKEEEACLLNRYGSELSADIFKASHHGLRRSTTEDFIQTVDPTYSFAPNHGYTDWTAMKNEAMYNLWKYSRYFLRIANLRTTIEISADQNGAELIQNYDISRDQAFNDRIAALKYKKLHRIRENEIRLSQYMFEYSGSEQKPDVSVSNMDASGYDTVYENNTDTGTAHAVITFKGDFSGNVTADYYIADKVIHERAGNDGYYMIGYCGDDENETARVFVRFPFRDTVEDAWYFSSVFNVWENGLMKGTSFSEFSPDSDITRAMVTTVIYRMENQPDVKGICGFLDLKKGSWYEKSVKWCAENGIVNGVDEFTFDPDSHIKRQDLATMLYRYSEFRKADVSAAQDLSTFTDYDQISKYAAASMSWAVAEGLIKGMSEYELSPNGYADRAQLAAVLDRYQQKFLN